ncbi:TPA: hypothetical protein ACTW8L_005309, partial [Klebsiella quasipneumoniae subsp. quasipneumoniae]
MTINQSFTYPNWLNNVLTVQKFPISKLTPVVSRPATCHNVIAGRRRTRFLNVLKTGFPAAPATPHGHAINCVPVHRFRIRRTPETGLTLAEW